MKFIKINDSTVVEVLDDLGYGLTDTVVNHPHFSDPNASLEDIKKKYHYPKDIQFIGFDKKEQAPEEKKVIEKTETPKDQKPKACPTPTPLEETKTSKKKKKKKAINEDKAAISSIPVSNNFPPQNPNGSIPLLLGFVAAYLWLLGFLMWKRQRERLLQHG